MAADLTFFSYARADASFVLKLAKDLRNAGVKLWLDQLDIKPGSRWDTSIENALNESTGLIVVLSPSSIASNNVLDEVNYALENNKKVIPVLYKDCATPFRLRRLQRIDFLGDYQTAFHSLLEALVHHRHHPTNEHTGKPEKVTTHLVKEEWAEDELVKKNVQAEKHLWEKSFKSNSIESFRHYLEMYPKGVYSADALTAIAKLESGKANEPSPPVSPTATNSQRNNLRKKILIAGAVAIVVLIAWLIIANTSSRKSSYKYLFNNEKKEVKTYFQLHRGAIESITFSPDGKTILTASADSTACLSDLQGKVLKRFEGHAGPVFTALFSADGKTILTGSKDKTARLWSVNGNLLREFKGAPGGVFIASFSPDGRIICTASKDVARWWDVNGKMLHEFHDSAFIVSIAFSPDSKKLLLAGNSLVRICDLDGNILRKWKAHTSLITEVAFSPDGKTIVTGSWDSTVRAWDLEGNELMTFNSHEEDAASLAFSPDGQRIASVLYREAFVYNLKSNVEWQITELPLIATSVAFSPDGKQLFLGTSHGTVMAVP